MSHLPLVPYNFLALPQQLSRLDTARVVVLPVPYDGTTSFRSGARNGPRAIIEASHSLEDYDLELAVDLSLVGIHTTDAIEPHMGGPQHMVERVQLAAASFVRQGKLLAMLGGEHSLSTGAVSALLEGCPDLSVLYLDAHGDFRDRYMDTAWGHASVARRIYERCPVVLFGTRSLCQEEREFLEAEGVSTFYWPPADCLENDMVKAIELLSPHVYVSIDLDVLDPSIMAAVGTPEPGGMNWQQITTFMRKVAEARQIVGFDLMELSPDEGPVSCSYTAAKLAYKMMAYSIFLGGAEEQETTPVRSERGQG